MSRRAAALCLFFQAAAAGNRPDGGQSRRTRPRPSRRRRGACPAYKQRLKEEHRAVRKPPPLPTAPDHSVASLDRTRFSLDRARNDSGGTAGQTPNLEHPPNATAFLGRAAS